MDVCGWNLNLSKILWLSWLPASLKTLKNESAFVPTTFSHYKWIGKNVHRSRASNSGANGPIWPKIEFFQDFITVFITCKFNEDPIKNKGCIFGTRFLHFKLIGDFYCHGNQFWWNLLQNLKTGRIEFPIDLWNLQDQLAKIQRSVGQSWSNFIFIFSGMGESCF